MQILSYLWHQFPSALIEQFSVKNLIKIDAKAVSAELLNSSYLCLPFNVVQDE